MTILVGNVAALAVTLIFYTWKSFEEQQQMRRRNVLRERVAYMLWVMAQRIENPSRELRVPVGSS